MTITQDKSFVNSKMPHKCQFCQPLPQTHQGVYFQVWPPGLRITPFPPCGTLSPSTVFPPPSDPRIDTNPSGCPPLLSLILTSPHLHHLHSKTSPHPQSFLCAREGKVPPHTCHHTLCQSHQRKDMAEIKYKAEVTTRGPGPCAAV